MTQLTVLHTAVDSIATNLPVLVDVAVRSSLVLLLALVVTTLMRRASAAARHTVWVCGVLVALMIPLIGRVAPRWETHVLPASWGALSVSPPLESSGSIAPASGPRDVVRSATVNRTGVVGFAAPVATPGSTPVAPVPLTSATTNATTSTTTRTASDAMTTPAFTSSSVAQGVALVWLIGAVLVLLRLAVGTGVVWSTARHARRVDDAEWLLLVQRKARELGIARPVILLASPRQTVPVTWGVIYPIVLLPESALRWEPARREAVLVHELAHVGRLDALTHTIVQLAVAALWFDPFVWIAARHVRSERERACDDLVLAHGTRPSVYADDLLAMVRTLTRNTEPAFAALAMARRSEFEGRMLAILDPRADRRRIGARGAAAAFACSLAIAFPLAALRPLPRAAAVGRARGTAASEVAVAATALSRAASSAGAASGALSAAAAALHTDAETLNGTLHVANALGGPSSLSCTLGNGQHVSIESTDGESSFLISNDSHCISMVSTGKVTFTDDDAAIKSISPGGHLTISEVTSGLRRRYVAWPANGGIVDTFYVSNEQSVQITSNRDWLRTVVQQIVRQDGTLAPERARRIRARSGVAGVLNEVNAITGDYGKAAYLEALVSEGGLTPDTLRLVTNLGVRELTSDYYKSQLLGLIAHQARDGATAAIMANAASGMSSDYYKRQVLSSALSGDGDRTAIAREVIATSTGIASEYDRAQVLQELLGRGKLGDALTVAAIQSAAGIKSDYYLSAVLDSVIATQPIGARPVYTALLQAARAIPSDYYRAQVLMHVLRSKDVPTDAVAALLSSASDIGSSNDKANVLVAAAATPAIRNQSVREAYFATAKTLGDGTEARRALTAVMP